MCAVQEDETRGGHQRGRQPRCIVLAPTRELAQQVEREFNGAAPTLSCGVFYGGERLLLITMSSLRCPAFHFEAARPPVKWMLMRLTPLHMRCNTACYRF